MVSRFEALRRKLPLTPFRLAILRSFTVEPLTVMLRASAFSAGIDLEVHVGAFNAWAQEMLDGSSTLYPFGPQAVVLAVHDATPEQLRECLQAFRRRSNASLILHTIEGPVTPARGVLDAQIQDGQWEELQQTNCELRRLGREWAGVYILDYDAVVARHGRQAWRDERKWLTARLPIAAGHLMHMVAEWMRFLHPMTGKVAKALAVDLDNILWGGVIGEDGIEGIALGPEYPGAAYQAVQRALLDLYQRGILLAVCSKNHCAEAMHALEGHPAMLLSPKHFAAMRINWADKADNLRQIAAELGIGTEALAFLDDDPVERQNIRRQLPEVMVVELPPAPMDYARAIRDSPVFERLTLTTEDTERAAFYAAERERGQVQQSCATAEDFYRSLEQEVEVTLANPMTIARVAQLTQKTNQFNLTTRRYSEQEIATMARQPGRQVYCLRAKDRYSDNGLVGVAITQDAGDTCEIDTLLLSCRVIGRTLETALLSWLAVQARARGAQKLEGWFLPTKKNTPAAEFYSQHGFQMIAQTEAGSRWSLDLSTADVACPDWIRFVHDQHDS